VSTIAAIRMKVRFNLRDTDSKMQSFDSAEIDQKIRDVYLVKGAGLPAAHKATSSALTILAGANTFTVPITKTTGSTTFSDASEVTLQLVSTGHFLQPVSREMLDAMRDSQQATVSGRPEFFTVYEDLDGVLRGICYPAAKGDEACNLFQSIGTQVPFSATNLDAAAIILTDPAQVALACLVAAELLPMIPDDELQRRRVNPRGVPTMLQAWRSEASRVFYREAIRRNGVQDVGLVERWVS
jgi:hypothetical protein